MRTMLLAVLLVAAACKAKIAEPAGFVDDSRMTKHADLPFHRAWRKDGVDWKRYSRVHVASVNIDHLLEMTWWQEKGRDAKKDIREMAEFTRTTLRDAFSNTERDNHYSVSDSHGGRSDTVILEFALVQIVPSKSMLEALSWAVPYGGSTVIQQGTKSSVAMEGRFRDAATGQVILAFRDREGEAARPIDHGGLKWYSHARGIIMDWSKQLVKVANQKPDQVIKDTKAFTLKPW